MPSINQSKTGNARPIKSITIVGGGTSACMTAAYLRKHLPKNIHINMVEPKNNSTIGVGEATVPSLKFFMRSLGLKESEWFESVDGTIKSAIKFSGWTTESDHYYHPFYKDTDLQKNNHINYDYNYSPCDVLTASVSGQSHYDFLKNVSLVQTICDNNLSPITRSNKALMNYAYHIDSHLFSQFLKNKALEWGVKDHYGSVIETKKSNCGFIESLALDSGETIESDFYIDATGFKSILMQDAFNEDFLDYGDRLFTNSALAMSFDHHDTSLLPPYTEAKATDTGWIWKIPLRKRFGAGIVFNSNYETFESAEQKLRSEFLGKEYPNTSILKIDMRVGRLKRSWVKNCVAIGLSNSFIEPLESTAIGITEYQIYLLRKLLPMTMDHGPSSEIYNKNVGDCFDSVVDFIALHYLLSDRTDSDFWQMVQEKKNSHESMRLIENIERTLIMGDVSRSYKMFDRFSYACIYTGLGHKVNLELTNNNEDDLKTYIRQQSDKFNILREKLLADSYLHSQYIF